MEADASVRRSGGRRAVRRPDLVVAPPEGTRAGADRRESESE